MNPFGSAGRTRRAARPCSFRPQVEPLEARDLLSLGSSLVADQVVKSAEQFSSFITQEYQQLLKRAPDPAGFAFFLDALSTGRSPESMEAAILVSAEYIQLNGNTTSSWITAIYKDLLNRTPDAAGFDFWINVIAPITAQLDIALAFINSQERQAGLITQNYTDLLGRAPEAGAVDFWLGVYEQGATRFDIASDIAGSDEFFIKAGNTPATFIVSIYQKVLKRTPSQGEINGWLALASL